MDFLKIIQGEKMLKMNIFLTIFALLLLSSSQINAQFLKIGIGGGLTQVTGPDDFTTEVSEGGKGFSTEWNGGIIAKLNLPIRPITPRAFFLYHSLNGNGEFSPLTKGTSESTFEFSQSILSFGVGLQYGFIPLPVGIDPYIALDLLYNNFGDFTTTTAGQETSTSGESRYGLAVGLGTEVTIIPAINLDLMLSYQLFNLAGKDDGEDTISAVTLDAFFIFGLQ